jgi:hypothetical protein
MINNDDYGYWNAVRQTAICEIVDRNQKRFQIRALIDGGSEISIVTEHVLNKTGGDWKRTFVPEINIQGVNSCSKISWISELKLRPSKHLGERYIEENKLKQFEVKAVFHVMQKPCVFANYRREYPAEIRKELSDNYVLADPILIEPGNERINIHAILGVNVIRYLSEKSLRVIDPPGVEIRRTTLGDMISGNTHFVEYEDRNELTAISDLITRYI